MRSTRERASLRAQLDDIVRVLDKSRVFSKCHWRIELPPQANLRIPYLELRFRGPWVCGSRLRCYGAGGRRRGILRPLKHEGSCPPMSYTNDQSKKSSTAFDQATTLVTVVELSRNSWLVAGVVPGINRHPLKKLAADENELLALLHRWQQQAVKAGRDIKRVVVAFEAGRDGFWLARWLRARGIEPHVIHATSIAVSREHRRAKTDRLDTEHLKRVVLGWLRAQSLPNGGNSDHRGRGCETSQPGA